MYHYVRPLKGSKFSKLKALELDAFERQVEYLAKNYNFVSPAQVVSSIKADTVLPERSVLLTFDDGYKDHIEHVYPILSARGISGVFFPPTGAIYEGRLLDVNRIHFLLASVDIKTLVRQLDESIRVSKTECQLDSVGKYREMYFVKNRYDDADTAYFKRMLQYALPESFRYEVACNLFSEHVSSNEACFSRDLYLNTTELKEMQNGGMEIGSHGHDHYWLGKIDQVAQAKDIDKSLAFLKGDGLLANDFWFCYPYGSYSETTQRLLKERGCGAAVTVEPSVASCVSKHALCLPRLDTNDVSS